MLSLLASFTQKPSENGHFSSQSYHTATERGHAFDYWIFGHATLLDFWITYGAAFGSVGHGFAFGLLDFWTRYAVGFLDRWTRCAFGWLDSSILQLDKLLRAIIRSFFLRLIGVGLLDDLG